MYVVINHFVRTASSSLAICRLGGGGGRAEEMGGEQRSDGCVDCDETGDDDEGGRDYGDDGGCGNDDNDDSDGGCGDDDGDETGDEDSDDDYIKGW